MKEIELCKAHLEIMTFRKEIAYSLETQNVDEYELIPPAVFLTIIENGISHQLPIDDKIHFNLNEKQLDNQRILSLHVSGKAAPINDQLSSGTGYKYIKARLQESYPDRWSFASSETPNGWETTITLG